MRAYYFDMDGVLANFHKAYATNKKVALSQDTMENLEPFVENVNLVRNLILNHQIVYILTKAANANAKTGKINWLAKYIPEFNISNFICIIGKGKKVDFIQEDGILIDDDEKNLKEWSKQGHETYFIKTKGETIVF